MDEVFSVQPHETAPLNKKTADALDARWARLQLGCYIAGSRWVETRFEILALYVLRQLGAGFSHMAVTAWRYDPGINDGDDASLPQVFDIDVR